LALEIISGITKNSRQVRKRFRPERRSAMQDIDKLLKGTVSDLTAGDLRALGYKCLEAAKSQSELALRTGLLARGLELAQQAEALENGKPRRRGPHKSGGTPGPDNPEA
jgi:hypothetical protein